MRYRATDIRQIRSIILNSKDFQHWRAPRAGFFFSILLQPLPTPENLPMNPIAILSYFKVRKYLKVLLFFSLSPFTAIYYFRNFRGG
ncbi:MAG: hypothetical protein Greene041679_386 [Parcubacteria group bacterium Greene0416_79]|nr:MAG: hypothetical protein Greene041679_386 [Parcubacteria group bacterium Greene0416_79]